MRETPPLSEQYYKARKSLAFFSALLFAWEFIGIEITSKPVQNFDVTLKSPQATPFILLALSVYFLIRVLIEWNQSSVHRRAVVASRVDLMVTLSIFTVAVFTFGIQQALEIQIANVARANFMYPFVGGSLISANFTYLYLRRALAGYNHPPPRIIHFVVPLGFVMVGMGMFVGSVWPALFGLFVGSLLGPCVTLPAFSLEIYREVKKRIKEKRSRGNSTAKDA